MIKDATRRLVEIASAATGALFKQRGQLVPLYHVIHANGRTEVIPAPPGDKDTSVALMRAYFQLTGIKRYVLVDECWRLDTIGWSPEDNNAAIAFCSKHGVRTHPRAIEAVMFTAEDELGQLNAYRTIERPKKGKATLGPLVWDPEGGNYEGRLVGMIRPAGKPQ